MRATPIIAAGTTLVAATAISAAFARKKDSSSMAIPTIAGVGAALGFGGLLAEQSKGFPKGLRGISFGTGAGIIAGAVIGAVLGSTLLRSKDSAKSATPADRNPAPVPTVVEKPTVKTPAPGDSPGAQPKPVAPAKHEVDIPRILPVKEEPKVEKPTPAPAPAPKPAPAPPSIPMLKVGSSGPDVAELKNVLRANHYLVDDGDVFTATTYDAVMAFQKVNHLDRDGVVGPQTREALKHPIQPEIGSGAANRIVVDKSDQVLHMVHNGQLDYTVAVSTGNPNLPDGQGSETPLGTYSVNRKIHGAHVAPLGTLYSPSYFYNGYAVHGSKSIPPYPASHGCVRIPMWVTEKLYDEMPGGFAVTIRD